MGQPFTLDVSSFEKLLEAAWVIQSQLPPDPSNTAQNAADSTKCDSIFLHKLDAIADPEPAEVETVPGGEFTLLPVDCELAVSRIGTIASRHRVRFTVASWEPLLVLLVIAVFFLFEVSSHDRHSPTAPFAASASTRTEGGISQQVVSQPVVSQRTVPWPNPTHLQITDPETAVVVERLSRYEIKSLQRQAKYGDDSAALTLGMSYETGHLVPQSCTKAADWVMAAATEGNAAAQYNLGLRYLYGDGLPMSVPEAQKWLEQASAKGYREPTVP